LYLSCFFIFLFLIKKQRQEIIFLTNRALIL